MMLRPSAHFPEADLRRAARPADPRLARRWPSELRHFLIDGRAARSGHLAAGLGAIELAIAAALRVRHARATGWSGTAATRPYPHQVLTGGASGCTRPQDRRPAPSPRAPKTSTTPAAPGHTGNASAPPRDGHGGRPPGERQRVVADRSASGALTAGMAFEALNHAGSLAVDLLVILNDNGRRSRGRIGALSNLWPGRSRVRLYARLRESGKRMLRQMPTMWEFARRSEKHLKGMVLPGTLFEEMGFQLRRPRRRA